MRWHFANGRTNYGSSSNNVDVNVDIEYGFGDVDPNDHWLGDDIGITHDQRQPD